jgi:hypothetical protein
MENKEQMPNDDIISVLYLFVELVHGKLPWRGCNDVEVGVFRRLSLFIGFRKSRIAS